ncbi:MAG: protease complex subunit PrcB family protein [Candidatus Thiodiazotropha lotti]|nr:protease complex subunit PrcB family protein [Candidatus Thiodiazotropha lotti]
MKVFNTLKWLGLSALCITMTACNVQDNSVSVVQDGVACSNNQAAGMHLVKKGVIKNVGGGVVMSDKSLKAGEEGKSDTDDSWLVRVDMGQQPSGGYGLKLLSDKLAIEEQTATLALQWSKPEPGMAQVQMITFPCLYLKIAKGDYTRLAVVDEEGNLKHSLDLP